MEQIHTIETRDILPSSLNKRENSASTLRDVISFLVLGIVCFSLSLSLYIFSFYALLEFLEFPLHSAFLDSPFIQPLVASSLACLLPPLFLITTHYSFLERAIRIFEIHAFLFIILLSILGTFCLYTISHEDAMASVLYVFYFAGISRLLCCIYFYISIRLSIASQKLPLSPHQGVSAVSKKNEETIPLLLSRTLLFSQMSAIILMFLIIFPLEIFGEANLISSYSLISLFFLLFYILYQMRTHPYKVWRLPYILVCSSIFIFYIQHENFIWQAILTSFYLCQCFVFYVLCKKSNNWFQ